jgi:hypothetical protein
VWAASRQLRPKTHSGYGPVMSVVQVASGVKGAAIVDIASRPSLRCRDSRSKSLLARLLPLSRKGGPVALSARVMGSELTHQGGRGDDVAGEVVTDDVVGADPGELSAVG